MFDDHPFTSHYPPGPDDGTRPDEAELEGAAEAVRALLERFGEVGFGRGLLWPCLAHRYDAVIAGWGLDPAQVRVFTRTSLGLLFCTDRGFIRALQPHTAEYLPVGRDVGRLFTDTLPSGRLDAPVLLRPTHERLVRKLGELGRNEMYTWVPALALGGREKVESAARVNLFAQHAILAQLQPLRIRNL